MKMLTLNTHSLIQGESEEKIQALAEHILFEGYDIIFLQEVNQKRSQEAVAKDNFAYRLQHKLCSYGLHYYLYYEKVHVGYECYDEGLAILSIAKADDVVSYTVSKSDLYEDYRRRKVFGISYEKTWFYNVHFSWEDDLYDSFTDQWSRFMKVIQKPCFVAGDFNIQSKGQAYQNIQLYDAYTLADKPKGSATVVGEIDGWENSYEEKRIDYIFTSEKQSVLDYRVVFNGIDGPVISDHYGVSVTFKDK